MINVAISGAFGRMGKELDSILSKNDDFIVSKVLVHEKIGSEFKDAIRVTSSRELLSKTITTIDIKTNAKISTKINTKVDIIIDFSSPSGVLDILNEALLHKDELPCFVICATGLQKEHFDLMKKVSEKTALFYSENTSIGIGVIEFFMGKLSAILDDNFDVSILERHHKHKKDSPSGTAIKLGKAIADGRKVIFDENFRINPIKYENGAISIHSIRCGEVFGEHEVSFAGEKEVVSINHRAISRALFAEGAVKIAKWIIKKENRFYSMKDYINDLDSV